MLSSLRMWLIAPNSGSDIGRVSQRKRSGFGVAKSLTGLVTSASACGGGSGLVKRVDDDVGQSTSILKLGSNVKVGTIEIQPVIDGVLVNKFPATKPLPGPDSFIWQDQHDAFRPDGTLESGLGAFLIRSADRVVVVDAGAGQERVGGYTPPVMNPDDPDDRLAGFLRSRGMPNEPRAAVRLRHA